MVVKIKGEEYGRAFDVNYVYFLWALMFEALFVVRGCMLASLLGALVLMTAMPEYQLC